VSQLTRRRRRWALVAAAFGLATGMRPEVPRAQDGAGRLPGPRMQPVRLEVLLSRRLLLVLAGADTLYRARIAVPSGRTLTVAGRTWHFTLPRGERRVTAKRERPVWIPPEWHYAEIARAEGLRMAPFPLAGVTLHDGSRLTVRDSVIGVVHRGDTAFLALPTEEHVIFDGTVFIPPMETLNRRVEGMLGAYALDLGGGYMIHGTRDLSSIGRAVTHGCIRLGDRDLAWVYERVAIGTPVWIR